MTYMILIANSIVKQSKRQKAGKLYLWIWSTPLRALLLTIPRIHPSASTPISACSFPSNRFGWWWHQPFLYSLY